MGDSNFMPIVGGTRIHSVPMEYVYKRLLAGFAKV
jgi:hypothetical protein